jgi:L-ascorbate metabolism protein UlaG (beta-lactamase superfamily)
VPDRQIRELSWWEQAGWDTLTFTCVPARHFSGRGILDRNETLWAGWIVQSGTKSVYHSGDTGYANHFAAIGQRYGPFDLTMIKIGAYGDSWPYIHVNPEETVKAHQELKGNVLLPIHWATFVLALHPWDEPIKRLTKAAKQNGIRIVTPRIGESVDLEKAISTPPWWEEVK